MRINEIFTSINGEVCASGQGSITTFVRFQGCNLRCPYCDTPEAQSVRYEGITEGMEMSADEVLACIPTYRVTITGGEPLFQPVALSELIGTLDPHNHEITIETNGTFPISPVLRNCRQLNWVVDYKLCPILPAGHSFVYSYLKTTDWIKIPIRDHADYIKAVHVHRKLSEFTIARFAFSPIHGELNPGVLFGWMQNDGLTDVSVNVQLHKYIHLK